MTRVFRRDLLQQLQLIYERNQAYNVSDETDRQTYVDICYSIGATFDIKLGNGNKYTHTPAHGHDNNNSSSQDEGYLSVYGESCIQFISKFADKYFSQHKYRTPEIDWFYADMLVLASKQVNKAKLRDEPFETAFPQLAAIVDKFVEKGLLSVLPKVLWLIFKWLTYAIILIVLIIFAFAYPIAGLAAAGMIGYTVYNFSRKRNIWNKIALRANRLFDRMDSTYNLLEQIEYDRELLKDDLSHWRQAGLYIPGPLWSACKPTINQQYSRLMHDDQATPLS